MSYQAKYLKYKEKYLTLKNQLGGWWCSRCPNNNNDSSDMCEACGGPNDAPVAAAAVSSPLRIHIKTMTGEMITLDDVSGDTRIIDLKRQVAELKRDFVVIKQRLVLRNSAGDQFQTLRNKDTLATYGIGNEQSLDLLIEHFECEDFTHQDYELIERTLMRGDRSALEHILIRRCGTLNLSESVNDDTIDMLASVLETNDTVTEIYLYGSRLSNMTSFGRMLSRNQTLRTIDLADNNININGAMELARGLSNNQHVTKINFGYNSFRDIGTTALSDMLKSNTTITEVDLERNDIGARGAASIGDMLRSNGSLRVINLSNNNIGSEGAALLFDGLVASNVVAIDLSYTNIGTEGVRALVKCLETNQTLTEINISNNNIDDEGALLLAYELNKNISITNINLSNNQFTDACIESLVHMLITIPNITNINLFGNRLTNTGIRLFVNALETNKHVTNVELKQINPLFHPDQGWDIHHPRYEMELQRWDPPPPFAPLEPDIAAQLAAILERNRQAQ